MMTQPSESPASALPRPVCTYPLAPSLEDLRRGSFCCPACGLVFQVDSAFARKWTDLLLSAMASRKHREALSPESPSDMSPRPER